jgi:esterase/lipase
MPYGKSLDKQHQTLPSARKRPFPERDFQQYSINYKNFIREALKSAALQPLEDYVIENRAPFEFVSPHCKQPIKTGLLFVHGLLDTPYIMRDLGAALADKCLIVRSILLPGHGTIPGDLLQINYQDWIEAFSAAVETFPPTVEQVIPIGYSTGASLALHYLQNVQVNHKVCGIVLLAPAIQAVDHNVRFSGLHRLYSWMIPIGAWSSLHEDKDLYKYESFPKNAAYQFHLLSQRVRQSNAVIRVPILLIGSAEDGTVEMETAVV